MIERLANDHVGLAAIAAFAVHFACFAAVLGYN